MKERFNKDVMWLAHAQVYADVNSECKKVKVGSVIKNAVGVFSYGANRVIPEGCDGVKCNRVLPHDGLPHCVSTIHSEVDAIVRAGEDLSGCTIYVTRYPCESCARAIITAGIKKVVYGRTPIISDDTDRIFKENNVEVIHVPAFNPPEGE